MNVRSILWSMALLFPLGLMSQSNAHPDLKPFENVEAYTYVGDESLSAEAFLQKFWSQLGLGPQDDLVLERVSKGLDGSEHLHYRQTYNGHIILAGELKLHLRNDAVYFVNGRIIRDLKANPQPQLSELDAFRLALQYFPSAVYAWEAQQKDRPAGELYWANRNFSDKGSDQRLTWRFDIHSYGPEERNWVYINAASGKLELALSRIHSSDTGTAVTKYSGTRTIYTSFDSDSSKYVLHDSLTGGGIFTYNMQKRTNKGSAVDFYDNDNHWNNFNANFDEVAGDAHWGTERVYHYFKDNFNRLSYDDLNSPLESYVHYDSNYVNAFWNGQHMTYGDGNGIASTPLISLDVVAHEIAHGVTSNSAQLIYQGEAGALNESFSDIFGAAIEFAYDSAGGDWKIGEDFLNTGSGIRNMRRPELFNHPNTYLGTDWGTGLFFDNGWVHFNSGVQNYWYYLLSDGDTGVNDNFEAYDIEGLGFQPAAGISYHNLVNYLGRWSDHEEARAFAMQSAIDLYGPCSNEFIQTTNAWYAAGVGEPTGTIDLSLDGLEFPARDCHLSANEQVIFVVRNNSCSQSIPAGATLSLSYSLNGGPLQTMSTSLTNALPVDSVFYIVHTNTADLSMVGNYDFTATVSYASDTLEYNNSLEQRVRQETYQNAEWKLIEVINPLSGCELEANTIIQLQAVFLGCDSLSAGTSIDLDYSSNGSNGPTLSHALTQAVHYADTLILDFASSEDLSARGNYSFNFTLNYPGDPTSTNNRIFNHRVLKPYELLGGKISFEDFAYADSLIVRQGINNGSRRNGVASIGNRGFEIVGGPLVNYASPFEVPRNDTVWEVNSSFRSTYCTCVDASNEGALSLNFDLRQSYTNLIRRLRSEPSNTPYSSSLRVLANDSAVSGTFLAQSLNADTFQLQTVNLDAYAGQYFELCFETHLMVDARTNNVTGDGDIINLDNIYLSSSKVSLKETKLPSELALFPNPSKGAFRLKWTDAKAGAYDLMIMDSQARIVDRRRIETQAGAQEWNFQTELSNGLYFVHINKPDGEVITKDLLVQH